MFKITMLVKKAPGITQQEFVAYWAAHSQKVLANQKALNIVRYAKTMPVFPEGQSTRRETVAFSYDAMGELWYESVQAFAEARNSETARVVLAELMADEARFCDLKNSVMWFGEEEAVIEFERYGTRLATDKFFK